MPASEPHRRPRHVQNLREQSTTTAQAVLVGKHLKRHREALGLEQKDVCALAGFSFSKYSRSERGFHKFKDDDIAALCRILRIGPEDREILYEAVANASAHFWWQAWRGVARGSLLSYISYEEMAKTIRSYEPTQLPGLMQTRAYAHAVIELGCAAGEDPRSEEEIERLLDLRMERIRRFLDSSSKRLVCVIDESALRRMFGDRQVMREQLDRLIELAAHPQFVIRIASLQSVNVPVMVGQTTLLEFEEPALPNVAFSEHYEGALVMQEEDMVDVRQMAFDRLRDASLAVRPSLQLLKDLRCKLYE